MLKIVAAEGRKQNPQAGDPSDMLSVVLRLTPDEDCEDCGEIFLWMDIESLNNSTRHHPNTGKKPSNMQLYHMMCSNADKVIQMKVLNEIAKAPDIFYDQLIDWNKIARNVPSPLKLFEDPNKKYNWKYVKSGLKSAGESIEAVLTEQHRLKREAEAKGVRFLDNVNTPCYGMLVSSDPNSGYLMDVSMSSVIHPPPGMDAMTSLAPPPPVMNETMAEG